MSQRLVTFNSGLLITASKRLSIIPSSTWNATPYLERIEASTKKIEESPKLIQEAESKLQGDISNMEERLLSMERIIRRADNVSKYALVASIIAIGLSAIPILELFGVIG